MNDCIDDFADTEEAEEDSDEIINQVLDEIGINLSSQVRTSSLTSCVVV